VTTLAGCTASNSGSSTKPNDVPAPSVRQKLLTDGWSKQADTTARIFEQSYLGGEVTVTGDAHSLLYENTGLRDRVKTETLGQFDAPLSVFSASRLQLSPNPADLPFGLGLKELLSKIQTRAETRFEAQLADSKLKNARKTGTDDLTLDSGEQTTLTRYTADFDYDSIQVPMPGTSNKRLTIKGGTLPVDGLLAVWQHDGHILVGGGAYPGANFTDTVQSDVTQAIHVTVDVDLGLTPAAYESSLLDLVKSVT